MSNFLWFNLSSYLVNLFLIEINNNAAVQKKCFGVILDHQYFWYKNIFSWKTVKQSKQKQKLEFQKTKIKKSYEKM